MTIERKFAPFLNKVALRVLYYRPAYFESTQELRTKWSDWTFRFKYFLSNKIEGMIGSLARLQTVFKVKQLDSFPAGENPFWHDAYRMGTYFGDKDQVCVMYGDRADDFVIVHIPSGQRIQVQIPAQKAKV